MSAAVLGLDIGSDSIKVVELAKQRGGYKLLNYGSTPTPPDAVVNGDVQDPEIIGDAIKLLLAGRKIKAKQVVSTVQGQQSMVVRIIEVPRMSDKELAETMQFEVERHVPFSASEIVMDYQVIDRPGELPDEQNMEVLIAAATVDMINLHVEALRHAKLKPVRIDAMPLALGRVGAGFGPDSVGATVAVVNIGATVTELSIIKDGVLHFPRAIPIAGRSITQRLSEALGCSEREAEGLKRQHASLEPLPEALLATVGVAAPAEEEAATGSVAADDLDFGADLFDLDTQEDSDVGFAGGGGGQAASLGLQFEEEDDAATVERPEEEGGDRSAFNLGEDLGDAGPTFDFGFDSDDEGSGYSLAGPDDDEDDPEAPVPDDEAFPLDVPEDDDAAGADATQPFDFGLAGDDDEDAPADEDSFSFAESEDSAPPADDSFGFAEADDSAPPADDDDGGFDFGLGTEPDQSSLESDPSGAEEATNVGASYDLGLDSSDSGLVFDTTPGTETAEGSLDETIAGDDPAVTQEDVLGEVTDTEGQAGSLEPVEVEPVGAMPAAEAGPPEPGAPVSEEALRVRQIIRPVVEEIAQEIARSLEYYRNRYEGAVVDKVVVFGGTSRIPYLAEFLEEELNYEVQIGDPLEHVVAVGKKMSAEELEHDKAVLGVAVGLAMGELG